MADTKKTKADKLDSLVLKWSALPKEGNEAQRARLKNEIFILTYELYKNNSQYSCDTFDKFWDVFYTALKKFDAEKGKFTHYLNTVLSMRKNDQYKKETVKKNTEVSWDDFNSSEQGDDENSSGEDRAMFKVVPLDSTTENVVMEDSLIELTALVLNFSERHTGRANNEDRKRWYRIFYTEDMTMAFKSCSFSCIYKHERDVFSSMHLDYLDYYMGKVCRTISQLSRTPLKTFGEVIPNYNKEDKALQLPLPLPAGVSMAYFHVKDSARSNQLKFYREELKKLYAGAI